MKTKQVLFVGGSQNAKVREISIGHNHFAVPVLSADMRPVSSKGPQVSDINEERYHQFGDFENIFVCEDMPREKAINRITAYIFQGVVQ